MKKTIYFTLFLFVTLISKAQTEEELNRLKGYDYEEFINKTLRNPEASKFVDYSSKGSVDVATGKFGINIPFYELSNKYIKIPIGLSYSTSGVKVEQTSSEVGLDWQLYGIGTITRIQKGHPDLNVQNDEYYYTGRSSYYEEKFETLQYGSVHFGAVMNRMSGFGSKPKGFGYINDFPNVEIGVGTNHRAGSYGKALMWMGEAFHHDTEPDIFMVNCGRVKFSFIIMYDPNFVGQTGHYAIPLDKKGVKIDLNDSVTITDTDGTIYEFKNFDKALPEYIRELYNFNENLSSNEDRVLQFTIRNKEDWFSTAKITKITLPNGEIINYKYIENNYSFPQRTPRKHTGEYNGYRYNIAPAMCKKSIDWLTTKVNSYQIDEIEFVKKCRIKFSYSGVRDDMDNCGLNLSKIELFDVNNVSIRKFDLIKMYSDGSDHYENYKDYRMFLKQIVDSKKEYSMDFGYHNYNLLPSCGRIEYADIYGYCRGSKTNYPNFPKVYVVPGYVQGSRVDYYEPNQGVFYTIRGEDRSVDMNTVGNGAMNLINFPTGGKLLVEYEPNLYYDSSLKGGNVFGPGVRVKKLNYYSDDVTKELVKYYEYYDLDNHDHSSGNILFEPYMAFITNWGWDNEIDRIGLQNKTQVGSTSYFSLWSNFYKSLFWSITDIPYITTERELRRKGKTQEQIIKKLISLSTHSMGPKHDIWGREMIYSSVIERIMSNSGDGEYSGLKEYKIHIGDNKPIVNVASGSTDDFTYIEPSGLSYVGSWDSWGDTKVSYGYVDKKGTDIYPFPDRDYFNTKHGLLNGKVVGVTEKDAEGNMVRITNYNYTKDGTESYSSVIKGYLPTHIYDEDDVDQRLIIFNEPVKEYQTCSGLYYFARNKYVVESPLLLESKRVVTYDNKGGWNEENLFYSYDEYGQVNEKIQYNSEKETIKTKVSYPADFRNDLAGFDPDNDIDDPDDESTAIYYMLENNILNLPVERIEINQTTGKVIRAEFIGYASKNKKIYPRSVQYLCVDEPIDYNSYFDLKIITTDPDYSYRIDYNENYQRQTTFDSYDDQFNLQQYSVRDMLMSSILWGYNGLYPIVKAENASISQLESSLSSVELNTVRLGDGVSDIEMRTIFNKIRIALPDAVVNTYTYKPLVGMSSQTDPKGVTTYYEYDELGRLLIVKDDDGNVLEKFKYNYGE